MPFLRLVRNSAIVRGLTEKEARRIGLLSIKGEEGLFGLFLGRNLHRVFLCERLLRAVELQDGSNPDAVGAYLLLGLLGRVLGVADLALDLYVRALLERGCELAELAEDDAAMPFGMRDVLADSLPL